MAILQHWRDRPEVASRAAVLKREIAGLGAALARLEIKAGVRAERHAHPHEQFVQVIEGSGILETEEGRQSFSAGSVFHFPAETWHEAVFDEDTILVETNLRA